MTATAIRSSIWIFAIAFCALPLLADGPQTSTIDGTITDAQGDGLPGVSVTLTGPQNTRTEITDANGDYRFALLQAGHYTVTADLEGLGSAERAVVLELGKREDVDLILGATAEEITVTSEAALITKYDTGAVSALGTEELQHVPQATRNYWSNMKLMAGVVSYKQEFDQAPGVNGGIGQENVLFIDGVDISHNRRGGEMTFYMPSTVVSENRMESAGFSAEYGRGVSGVMNTTIKTGTNEFHGDFLYIGQNPAWRSENWLEMERPDSMINSYETGLGGPLFRDKAWFYASLSEMNDNRLDLTRDGNTINTNRTAEPLVGKVNTQPNDRHQLALTLIDSPSGRLNPPGSAGDIYSVTRNSWNNRIQTLTWSFALTNSAFLEAKAANRELQTARIGSPPAEILPGASPDTPDGNNFRYRDLADGRRYNAPVNRLGAGGNDFPRDQANASLTFFRGKHEFKAGIDVQDVTFATITSIGSEYRGRGYGRSLPGGYESPVNKRVFDCPVPCNTAFTSGIGAAYVQDRITVGDHLTVSLGLRQDTQDIKNNLGQEVMDYQKVAPRLSAVYDLNADGRMLLRASAGRYYDYIGLGVVFTEFTAGANGENAYTQYGWNSETELYDVFQRRVEPRDPLASSVEPYYKEEISVGFDWQFSNNWVFKSRVTSWDMENMFHSTLQFDEQGAVVRDLRNWPQNRREYEGILLQLNRAFRNDWSLQMNYARDWNEGNNESRNDNDDHMEGFGGIEVSTGILNPTSGPNWFGPISYQRDHIVNVVGMKRWRFGSHDLMTSASAHLADGEPWGLQPATQVRHPVSGQTITTTTLRDKRGTNRLDDFFTLNLNATYQFPIRGGVQGIIGGEVANVTNEQALILINTRNGNPAGSLDTYQYTREFRLKVGVRF